MFTLIIQKRTCKKNWSIKKIYTHQWKCLKETVWRSNNQYHKIFLSVMNKKTLKNTTFLNVDKTAIHLKSNWLKLQVKKTSIWIFLKSRLKELLSTKNAIRLKMIRFHKNLGKAYPNSTEKLNFPSNNIVKIKIHNLKIHVRFPSIDIYLQNKCKLKNQVFFFNVNKF